MPSQQPRHKAKPTVRHRTNAHQHLARTHEGEEHRCLPKLVAELLERKVAVLDVVLASIVEHEPCRGQRVERRVLVLGLDVLDGGRAVGVGVSCESSIFASAGRSFSLSNNGPTIARLASHRTAPHRIEGQHTTRQRRFPLPVGQRQPHDPATLQLLPSSPHAHNYGAQKLTPGEAGSARAGSAPASRRARRPGSPSR